MINKIKLYIILAALGLIIGTVVYFSTTYSFVKKKEIKQKTDSIYKLKKEVALQDSLLWSLQQDLDICNQNKPNYETTISQLTKERNEARAEAKRNLEAIEHYETNDLMRYFVFDRQGIFKKGCYQEVFKKPDNICK